jgi:hypothetical protein
MNRFKALVFAAALVGLVLKSAAEVTHFFTTL